MSNSESNQHDREQKAVLTVIAVIIIIGVIIYALSYNGIFNWKDSETDTDIETTNEDKEDDISGNKVVIQNENSQTAEGKNLPTDINFGIMIPRELNEENLVGVVDNKQTDSRNVTLKYKMTGNTADIRVSLVDGLTKMNWTISSQTDVIMGNQTDKRIAVNLEQVDVDNVYVTVLLNIYEESLN